MNFRLLAKTNNPKSLLIGVLAISIYVIHGTYNITLQRPECLIWACDLATLLVGLGIIFKLPTMNAIGFLWLSLGVSLWAIDFATGGDYTITSPLLHIGGLMIGVYGIRTLGMARGAWWKALIGLFGLQIISRALTPPEKNANLAFDVWVGWESYFPSYFWYMVMLYAISTLMFIGLERALYPILIRRDRPAR